MERKETRPKLMPLKTMDIAQKNAFLDSFDFVVSDVEGIIWKNGERRPLAGCIINGLKRIKKIYCYVIDDSYTSDTSVVEGLKEIGVKSITKRYVLTPAKIVHHYLREHKKNMPVFSLCNEITNDYLTAHSIEVLTSPPLVQKLTIPQMEDALQVKKEVGAVLIDVNFNTSYYALALANQYLVASPEADVLCTSDEMTYKICPELRTMGAAGCIALLMEGIECDPIKLSRPHSYLGPIIRKYFVINDPERVLFIGNSLVKDIKFGIACGFQTLFLMDNNLKPNEMRALPEVHKPNYIADSFADFALIVDLTPEPPLPKPMGVRRPIPVTSIV